LRRRERQTQARWAPPVGMIVHQITSPVSSSNRAAGRQFDSRALVKAMSRLSLRKESSREFVRASGRRPAEKMNPRLPRSTAVLPLSQGAETQIPEQSLGPPASIIAGGGTTRMHLLKQATRSAHDRIERALPLLDRSLTGERYLRVLQSLYGFYAPLEPLCEVEAGPTAAVLELKTRRKAPLLADDLAILGHAHSEIQALPSCRTLPMVTEPSQAIGVLYVLEGATLGGQIISQRLRESLAITAANGGSFFACYGDGRREMWRRFAAHVDGAPNLDVDTAIAAAIETFESLERWLTASRAAR
jgi:heme oxygenase